MKIQTLIFICIFSVLVTFGQTPGTLDPDYGYGGISFADNNSCDNFSYSSVIQDDSKIVLAGYSNLNNTIYPTFMRFLPDGTLDSSFGSNGISIFLPVLGHNEWINNVIIQPDGKIVATGYDSDSDFNSDMIVMRLNSDGSLDNTFNGTGKIQISFGSSNDSFGQSLALMDNGKIISAGYTWDVNNDLQCAFCRLNEDGTLDNSFGTGGLVIMNLAGMQNYMNNVSMQGDKIVIGGISYQTGQAYITLSRYNSNGILDSGFGQNGLVNIEVEMDNFLMSPNGDMLIDDQNRILYGTYVLGIQSTDFALFRFQADGAPDNSFGDFGLSVVDMLGNSAINSLAVQNDGKIIAGGYIEINGLRNFSLVRFLENGDPDVSFGGTGIVITNPSPLSSGYDSNITYVGVQADGKIIVTGYSTNSFGNIDFVSARYFSGLNVGINSPDNFEFSFDVHPNPIAEKAVITFDLKEPERVKAEVINITGESLLTITDEVFHEGRNSLKWDINGLPTGVYFVRLTAGDNRYLRKIVKQ